MFHVSCVMCHLSCFISHMPCVLFHVSCILCHVLCVMYYVSYVMFLESCVMSYVSYVMFHVLLFWTLLFQPFSEQSSREMNSNNLMLIFNKRIIFWTCSTSSKRLTVQLFIKLYFLTGKLFQEFNFPRNEMIGASVTVACCLATIFMEGMVG